MASSSAGKKYFCRLSAEFGRVIDGNLDVKQPSTVTWLDLDYDEAMTLQVLVFRPMLNELADDSYELGVQKAVEDGTIDQSTAAILLGALGKQEKSVPRKR